MMLRQTYRQTHTHTYTHAHRQTDTHTDTDTHPDGFLDGWHFLEFHSVCECLALSRVGQWLVSHIRVQIINHEANAFDLHFLFGLSGKWRQGSLSVGKNKTRLAVLNGKKMSVKVSNQHGVHQPLYKNTYSNPLLKASPTRLNQFSAVEQLPNETGNMA